jgi:SAM-dependent methyltransferase
MSKASPIDRVLRFHRGRACLSDRDIAALLHIERDRETMTDLIASLRSFGTQHLAFEPASFGEIREIVTALDLGRRDIVYDLGAGYGHFVCYGACVTAARFEAVEIVPARCAAMRRSAARLGLRTVRVIEVDAETVPFDRASVLFLNSPFFAEKADRFLTRLAWLRPWRPLRIAAMNNIVRHFRDSDAFVEIETGANIAPYRFGMFRPKHARR